MTTLYSLCIVCSLLASLVTSLSPLWIEEQYNASLSGLLENIFPNGTVIASPSRNDPDYYYHVLPLLRRSFKWIRDAGMVMGHLVHRFEEGETQHKDLILAYALHEQRLQNTPNPSGDFYSGGLGEPKFHVDGTQYLGAWARPQNDGPAIRALTLSRFARHLLQSMSAEEFVAQYPFLYTPSLPANSTIKADLEYVSNHWPDLNYDPWEESCALGHFFNLIMTREALLVGAKLARDLNDPGAADWYELQFSEVNDYLEGFWHENDGYIKSSIDHQSGVQWKTKNLDSAILIGVLFANSSMVEDSYSIGAQSHSTPLTVVSDRVMSTFVALNASFAHKWPINKDEFSPCFGRYEEDIYDGNGFSGGNPWFLNTLAAAEYLYSIIPHILNPTKRGFNLSHPFFEAYAISRDTVEFQQVLGLETERNELACTVAKDADARLGWVKRYREGTDLSEQFSRYKGKQMGAKKLTWSYEAYLKAVNSRRRLDGWIENCK